VKLLSGLLALAIGAPAFEAASILLIAFERDTFEMSMPPRTENAQFDIVAKLPAGAANEQFHQMLRRATAAPNSITWRRK
jgi:uncharacterized protein (TIGR03435 family)